MAENSAIEWTDHTFNPWEGCQKVSPGCDHCYAEARNARYGKGVAANWGPGAPRRRTSAANWRKPLQWQKAAPAFLAEHGRRQRVFCASLADVFDNAVPSVWREDLFEMIRVTPDLDWLLLTKRIGNVVDMVRRDGAIAGNGTRYLPDNVWLGATIVNQTEADRDIPKLIATKPEIGARVIFLSMEPLLGPVDLDHFLRPRWPSCGCPLPVADADVVTDRNGVERCPACNYALGGDPAVPLDWVIVGGESGHGARPMHPRWAITLRDQCERAGVPFLFKQWGEWAPHYYPAAGVVHVELDGRQLRAPTETSYSMRRIGKKAAGRKLIGVQHDGMPA